MARPCVLPGLARSSSYYAPTGEHLENLSLQPWLDEQYTQTPFFGVWRMTAAVRAVG